MRKKTKKFLILTKNRKPEYLSQRLFCIMALGGRASLRYDYELHCKVHYNTALAQHSPQNQGILADLF